MKEIISAITKKPLNQVFNIISTILILVDFINNNTIIKIKIDYFDFISSNNNQADAMISHLYLLCFIIFIGNCLRKLILRRYYMDDNPDKERMAQIFTLYDIANLISSISALLILFMYIYGGHNKSFPYYILCIYILGKFAFNLYDHYFYRNKAFLNKYYSKTINNDNEKSN